MSAQSPSTGFKEQVGILPAFCQSLSLSEAALSDTFILQQFGLNCINPLVMESFFGFHQIFKILTFWTLQNVQYTDSLLLYSVMMLRRFGFFQSREIIGNISQYTKNCHDKICHY